jgi:hypothetical protein
MDLRFRHQAVWREAHGQDPCSCLKNMWLFTIGWLCLRDRFLYMCTICAWIFKDRFQQNDHWAWLGSGFEDIWVEVWSWFIWQESRQECACLCKNGDIQDEKHVIISFMGTKHLRHQVNHLYDNISDGDIKDFVLTYYRSLQTRS